MAYLPNVAPGQKITSQHINAIKESVHNWLGDVDGKGFTLKNAKFDAASKAAAQTPWGQDIDAAGFTLKNALIGAGSSIPWDSVSGKPANFQTPWAQDIDGAGFDLYKAGTAQFTQNHPPPSGAGVELAYDSIGHIVAYDRTAATYKELRLYGVPLDLYAGGTKVMRIESERAVVSGWVESAVGKGFANNLYYDGAWRFRDNGSASLFHSSNQGFSAIYTASTGLSGAVASISQAIKFRDDGVVEIPRILYQKEPSAGSGAYCQFQSSGDLTRWQHGLGLSPGNYFIARFNDAGSLIDYPFTITRSSGVVTVGAGSVLAMGNANGERIRVYDSGGINHAIGVEANTMWFQASVNSVFRWYVGTDPDNGTSAKLALTATELLGDLVIAVKGQNGFSWNAKWAGNWYYVGPGNAPASMMYCDTATGGLRWLIGPTGTPGTVVPFVTAMEIWNGGVALKLNLILNSVPTSPPALSGSVWRDAAAGNVLKIVP